MRASSESDGLATAIQSVALELDPDLGRPQVVTFESIIETQAAEFRVVAVLLTALAVLLALLSALGLFGVVGFAVANRTREIGIRMSMGATQGRVLGSVLGDGLKLALPGLVGGSLMGVLFGRLALAPYYIQIGLPTADALVFGVAAALALAVILLASIVPAHRAASVQPMEILRAD